MSKPHSSATKQRLEVVSAADLLVKPVPTIHFYWGDLLRSKGRLAVIGKPKVAKSFFVMQLGLHMAIGRKFLGMDTTQCVVLYLNFEISKEKLHERVQDCCAELDIEQPEDFLVVTVDGGLPLDTPKGTERLNVLIEEVIDGYGALDVLIIDPRRQAMEGDENQSEVLTAWGNNIDRLRARHKMAVVVVHHQGKATGGAGRGSRTEISLQDPTLASFGSADRSLLFA